MNINRIKNKAIKKKPGTTTKHRIQDVSFSALLADQIQAPLPAQQSEPLHAVQINSSMSAANRTNGIALTEKTINFLAAYGDALENLHLDISAIRPLVEAMEEGTTSLLDIKEQLDDDDPLAELLDRVAAIAYLESEKFRRGDYDS